MSQPERLSNKIIESGLVVVIIALIAYVAWGGPKYSSEAKVGDEAPVARERKIHPVNPEPLWLRVSEGSGGITDRLMRAEDSCTIAFGAKQKILGRDGGRFLVRYLPVAFAEVEYCPEGALFWLAGDEFDRSFYEYEIEFKRRQEAKAKRESDSKLVRQFLAQERK